MSVHDAMSYVTGAFGAALIAWAFPVPAGATRAQKLIGVAMFVAGIVLIAESVK